MWHLVELIKASSLDVSAITQDLLSYFPALVPLIISHHPVQGSFPGWLIYRKHIFCLVKVSRLQSLFRSRPKPTVSLCQAILSIFLHLLFNSTYLCLWHARARLCAQSCCATEHYPVFGGGMRRGGGWFISKAALSA